jgi:hypothetical protein
MSFHLLKLRVVAFFVITPRSFIGGSKRFGGSYCLHLHLHFRENLTYETDVMSDLSLLLYSIQIKEVIFLNGISVKI